MMLSIVIVLCIVGRWCLFSGGWFTKVVLFWFGRRCIGVSGDAQPTAIKSEVVAQPTIKKEPAGD
jgi:hypothetical protein